MPAINYARGDSDSTGIIAGDILGAVFGKDAIPANWLTRLEMRAELEALANELFTVYRADQAWLQRYPHV